MAKIRVLAENPPPPRGYVEDQLRELRDYLTRLKDELEYLLTHLDTDNFSGELRTNIQQLRADADASAEQITALETELAVKANQAQLAHVQETNIADHTYKAGAHFCYAGNLYRTTTPVGTGTTLERGTNCVRVTAGAGLVSTRTVTATTNAQGRLNTALNIANAIVLSAVATGYFCSVYVNNNVQGVEVRDLNGAVVASTSVTVTLAVLYV